VSPYWGVAPYPAWAPSEEKSFLENEVALLEQQLAAVKERLDQIGKESVEE
jgi:uncharacterized protein YceH (UPF0502 family)